MDRKVEAPIKPTEEMKVRVALVAAHNNHVSQFSKSPADVQS